MTKMQLSDELTPLLDLLPSRLGHRLREGANSDGLIEVVLDLGRPPIARYPGHNIQLDPEPLQAEQLAAIATPLGAFDQNNRTGLPGTLHRISALRNRGGDIIGLTLRVGRALSGTLAPLRDLIETGSSILLLGPPGVGKTTRLRELARTLADDFDKRVMVIDTSNEIGGDGDVPHPAIGNARRMQVARVDQQHAVMIEAVENHMPEVIVVDEIGTAEEVLAARTIAERGVQLIGTAHGNRLESLVRNPVLNDLVGGVQNVTLGDEEARIRGSMRKTVSERRADPTFTAVVEILGHDDLVVHRHASTAVDALLRGHSPGGSRRRHSVEADAQPEREVQPKLLTTPPPLPPKESRHPVRVFPYGIPRDSLDRALRDIGINARSVGRAEKANLIVALRARVEDPQLEEMVAATGIPVYMVRRGTTAQIRRMLQHRLPQLNKPADSELAVAVQEAEAAANRAMVEGIEVELRPQSPSVRQVQHRILSGYRLKATSEGCEPDRRLVVQPQS